jgi:hypothetical protein
MRWLARSALVSISFQRLYGWASRNILPAKNGVVMSFRLTVILTVSPETVRRLMVLMYVLFR